jgi:aspartyl/asparaginyl beta-hydroxylase (cupin superfamily)
MNTVNRPIHDDERIKQLIKAAYEALGSGRQAEADSLMREAELAGPRHPLVLNELGHRRLMAGNVAGAFEVLDQSTKDDPENPSAWINLAAALRGLDRRDEEMRALDRVLVLDPGNLRALLQKGSLQELQNNSRAAAVSYRTALQSIRPWTPVPPAMHEILAHARRVVEGNNRALESFLEDRLGQLRARHSDMPLKRFDRCLGILTQRDRIYRQQPSFLYFPQLAPVEFYERSDFPWLDAIEAATDDIRAELIDLLSDGQAVLEPYVTQGTSGTVDQKWRELHQSRRWGVYYLWREGRAYPEHIARFPKTVAALSAWPRCEVPGCSPTAVFSILDAKTRIPPHTGVNNTRLIVHVPLIIPPGCGFRCGGEQREWQPGKAFVFDDTIEHEAWNESDVPRAVLILDIWNPALSEVEREMLSEAISGVNDFYGFSQQQGV